MRINPANPNVKDIHDTHWRSTKYNLLYPDAFTNILTNYQLNVIETHYENIVKIFGLLFKPQCGPHPESKTAFQIFAIDTIIDTEQNVCIIGVNDKVGYKPANDIYDDAYKQLCYEYFEWVFNEAIFPLMQRIEDIKKL